MKEPPVHWYEGMFLRTQHFTRSQRNIAELIAIGDRWGQPYNWGLGSIEINPDALAAGRLSVTSLLARMRDGTIINVPQDGELAVIDLKEAFGDDRTVTMYLGCPQLSDWRPNVAPPGKPSDTRYSSVPAEVEDETTGEMPQTINVLRINLRLLTSDAEAAGIEAIPIARLVQSERSDSLPRLDPTYIPPLVACDAWAPLQVGILQSVRYRIGGKMGVLAQQAITREISFDSTDRGDAKLLAQLRELNEAYAALGLIAYTRGIHPLPAYLELCRVAGALAIFGDSRRMADLPPYDHDDLGRCFFAVKRFLDELLDAMTEPVYKERPFVGVGARMQVELESVWVRPEWHIFVGVQTSVPIDECIDLITHPGRLDMKVGSSDDVDRLYRLGRPGLRFRYVSQPPISLPAPPGMVFFQLEREPGVSNEWHAVERSLSLAIRPSERLVAGEIEGRRQLAIRVGDRSETMQFTLFAVPIWADLPRALPGPTDE
jgi:type VI secretion system protein ImpJ